MKGLGVCFIQRGLILSSLFVQIPEYVLDRILFKKRRDSRLAEISEQYPLVRIDKIAFNCQLHLLLGRKAGSNGEVLLSIC